MNKSTSLCALAIAMGLGCAATAEAARITPAEMRQKNATEAFRFAPKFNPGAKPWRFTASESAPSRLTKAISTPDVSLPAAQNGTYLEMPDGRVWFATIDLVQEAIGGNEYYTEYNITGVDITVYDDEFNKVGHIADDIVIPEGYSKCTAVNLGSQVTRKFFNTDDSYELMVLASFMPENAYGAVPFTHVYSLKGGETNATKVTELPGYYTVAVNNPADSFSEDFFMMFFAGEETDDDAFYYNFDIYGKAGWGDTCCKKIKSIRKNMLYVMSDGENESIPVMINSKGRELYIADTQYEKTFFSNPLDFTDDSLSPDNKFIIDYYVKGSYDTEASLKKTLTIPLAEPTGTFTMRSYSLGYFNYNNDISFDFADDGNPSFVIYCCPIKFFEAG